MVPPLLIAAVLVVGLVALWPAHRLYVAGRSTTTIGLYFAGLFVLGVLIALAPRLGRLVLPLLLILYVVPFINWRAGLDRLIGRRPREVRPPMKDVTPRDEATRTR